MFKIFDWAGNDKTPYYGLFNTFEDAWGRLYEEFEKEGLDCDEYAQEFYVEQFALDRIQRTGSMDT